MLLVTISNTNLYIFFNFEQNKQEVVTEVAETLYSKTFIPDQEVT